jgi:hypothetical protein
MNIFVCCSGEGFALHVLHSGRVLSSLVPKHLCFSYSTHLIELVSSISMFCLRVLFLSRSDARSVSCTAYLMAGSTWETSRRTNTLPNLCDRTLDMEHGGDCLVNFQVPMPSRFLNVKDLEFGTGCYAAFPEQDLRLRKTDELAQGTMSCS